MLKQAKLAVSFVVVAFLLIAEGALDACGFQRLRTGILIDCGQPF